MNLILLTNKTPKKLTKVIPTAATVIHRRSFMQAGEADKKKNLFWNLFEGNIYYVNR